MKNIQKVQDNAPINDFNGHYQFMNNDHPAWVALDGVLFPSVAVAYQAARTDNLALRQIINETETYDKLKEIALTINNPNDWNFKKQKIMQKLVRDKFKRSRQFGSKLASTHPRTLINSFKEGGQNQQYWGTVNGKGSNTLGKILMSIRQQILKNLDNQRWVCDQGVQNDQKMYPEVSLIVIRDQKPIDKLFLQKKNKFYFGALASNDFKLDHPSISKQHACVYFSNDSQLMLVDLGSSHGTTLIRGGKTIKLQALTPTVIEKDDLIVFGLSSRKYKVFVDWSKIQALKKGKKKQNEQNEKQKIRRRKSRSRSRSHSPAKNERTK